MLGGLKNPGMRYFILGGLQRQPVKHRLWTVLCRIPHSWQHQLRKTGQANWTALCLGEQCQQLEEWCTELSVFGDRGEEHTDDLCSQTIVPAAERVD